MATQTESAVVAAYPTRAQAEAAVDELWHAGFDKEQVGFAIPGEGWHRATTATENIEEDAAHGAVVGSITGGTLGALAGAIAVGMIPGFGTIIAGGMLMGIIGGAAAGSALGTFAGPFIAMGFSQEDVHTYEAAFRGGKTIVTVRANGRQDDALLILRKHGPVQAHIAQPRSVGSQTVPYRNEPAMK